METALVAGRLWREGDGGQPRKAAIGLQLAGAGQGLVRPAAGLRSSVPGGTEHGSCGSQWLGGRPRRARGCAPTRPDRYTPLNRRSWDVLSSPSSPLPRSPSLPSPPSSTQASPSHLFPVSFLSFSFPASLDRPFHSFTASIPLLWP